MMKPSLHRWSLRTPIGHPAPLQICSRNGLGLRTKASPSNAVSVNTAALADEWYSPSSPPLKRSIGAIQVVSLEGKGRGVVATHDLQPGELLLVCEPLAFLRAPEGQRPDAEALVDAVLEQGGHNSRWFQEFLYDGTEKSTTSVPDLHERPDSPSPSAGGSSSSKGGSAAEPAGHQAAGTSSSSSSSAAAGKEPAGQHPAAKRLAKKGSGSSGSGAGFGAKVRAAAAGKRGAAAKGDGLPGGVDRATAKRVAKMVRFNCFGDAHDDRAAAACRGQPTTAHIGVWPEMSMLNHSCSPNAINYVLGADSLVVRAACHIKAGDEVTISYLGRPQLIPVEQRIELLREDYGFTCECERCTAELVHMDKLHGQYEELHEEVSEELGPLFLIAKDKRDLEAVQTVRDRLRRLMSGLYATFRKAFIQPQVRLFFLASLYDAFELQMASEALAADMEQQQQQQQQGATGSSSMASSSTSQAAAAAAEPTMGDQALAQCLRAIQEVSPGSDLHVILAARHLHRTIELHGHGSAQSLAAQETAVRAHVLRYGQTSPQLTKRLIELNRTLYD